MEGSPATTPPWSPVATIEKIALMIDLAAIAPEVRRAHPR
jgi:hypothetical protein